MYVNYNTMRGRMKKYLIVLVLIIVVYGYGISPVEIKGSGVYYYGEVLGSEGIEELCDAKDRLLLRLSQNNPRGLSSGSSRVYRGSSWYDYASCCRIAFRYYDYPGYSSLDLGFRIACSSK